MYVSQRQTYDVLLSYLPFSHLTFMEYFLQQFFSFQLCFTSGISNISAPVTTTFNPQL